MNGRRLLEGCGISIALTLSYIWEPLAPAHIKGLYLRVLPVSSVGGGALIDLIAAAVGALGLLYLLERIDKPQRTLIWTLLVAVVPATLAHSALSLAEINFHVPSTLLIATFLLIPAVIVWWLSRSTYEKLIRTFRLGYACLGFCMIWVLPELYYSATHREPKDVMQMERPMSVAASGTSQTRIVWLLMDELSYDQTFDHRQSGLKLDNFDALRNSSISFADVQPAGNMTDEIIPSLLTGKPVVEIESSLDGDLLVKQSSGGEWERLAPHETVFGDAERLGWSTAIAGWFNPYCRLFGTMVNRCVWEPESRLFPGHMTAANSAWQNALAPLGAKFHVAEDTRLAAEHAHAYQVLAEQSIAIVRDGGERFVFLHLPVPHPPGFFDRAKSMMRIGGSYLDNLVLADTTLAAIRGAIDKSPDAANTILIVSSDHSMRVPQWRGGASWTAEDERVFGDRFDSRPVLMVHFAGQQTGETVNAPFAELRTHDMIEAMLGGKMSSAQQMQAWARELR